MGDEQHRPQLQFLFGRLNYERTPTVPYQAGHFKLDRMIELSQRLGDSHKRLTIVHIAGSKGKGSTATMVSSILTAAGYKVGLYTSPHLVDPEERIRVDGKNCSSAEFDQLLAMIEPQVGEMDRRLKDGQQQPGPTYFEILTAAAFLHFEQVKVDVAVIEVGLGGRLDSTNICTPTCSVITTISKDHTKQLGDTLPQIAGEKAGIIKQSIPVVSGVTEPRSQSVIQSRATELNCRLYEREQNFDCWPTTDGRFVYRELRDPDSAVSESDDSNSQEPPFELDRLKTAMIGDHQRSNAAVAIRTVRLLAAKGVTVSDEAIRAGLLAARSPARIEVFDRKPLTIVDAAHNEASAAALVKTVQQRWPQHRITFVLAATRGKDVRSILKQLLPAAERIVLTKYLNNPRCCDPHKLATIAESMRGQLPEEYPHIVVEPHPEAAWRAAEVMATKSTDLTRLPLICITGSFFVAAELRPLLLAAEPATPDRSSEEQTTKPPTSGDKTSASDIVAR